METDDVFSQGIENDDDPFALADSEFEQARTEEPVAGVPVVNAEGQPVPVAGDAPAAGSVLEGAKNPPAVGWDPGPPAAAPAAPTPPPAQPAASESPNPDMGKTIGQIADEKAAAAAEAATAEGVPAAEEKVERAEEAVSVHPDAAAEADLAQAKTEYGTALSEADEAHVDPTPAAPSPPATQPAAPTGPASDPAPDPAKKVAKKKAPDGYRRYLLFTPTAAGVFKEVVWYENGRKQIVVKDAEGAKKTTSVLARGQDEALHVGYAALGSPPDGVKLVAVAEGYWNVKHVAPDPEPPVRVKLAIR